MSASEGTQYETAEEGDGMTILGQSDDDVPTQEIRGNLEVDWGTLPDDYTFDETAETQPYIVGDLETDNDHEGSHNETVFELEDEALVDADEGAIERVDPDDSKNNDEEKLMTAVGAEESSEGDGGEEVKDDVEPNVEDEEESEKLGPTTATRIRSVPRKITSYATLQLKTLQDDPLLRRLSKDQPLNAGTVVWAQDQGSIYWPACIVPIPPPAPGEEDPIDESLTAEFAFVMFIEPKFRLGMIKWSNIIEVDVGYVNAQKTLVVDLNKLQSKKKSRKSYAPPAFEKACELLAEIIGVRENLRQEYMQKKFLEFKNESKTKTKEPKAKPQTPQLNSKMKGTQSVHKLSGNVDDPSSPVPASGRSQKGRIASLRQNPALAKQWTYPSSSSSSPAIPPLESQEQSSNSAQLLMISSKKATTKYLRPKSLDGEALQNWTWDKFELMDKSMKFDSNPCVSCGSCRVEIADESQLATCHEYPFHKSCLTEVEVSQPSGAEGSDEITTKKHKCEYCISEICFICKKGNSELLGKPAKCSKCDLRFHRDCLVFNWPQADVFGSNGPITCPLHFCHGCKAEHFHSDIVRDYRLPNSKGIRCLYCLSAYHKASCVPAGCGNTIMKNQFLICPRHAAEKAPPRKNKRLGCFSCQSKLKAKDSVVNCTLCPLSFHASCVHGEYHLKAGISLEALQKTFKCEACLWGMFPRYGQVIWFQQPGSSYWPSMILYPRDGAGRGATGEGQFSVGYCGYPVQFYDNGRTSDSLSFEIGSKDFLKKLNLFSNEKVGVAAKEAFHLLKYSEANRQKILPKAEPIFRKIDKNLYRVQMSTINRSGAKKNASKRKSSEEEERCLCGKEKDDGAPTCTPNSGCFNRDAAVECNAANCSGNEKCQNRMFTMKQHNEHLLEYFVSPSTKGWGLKTLAPFTEGTYLCEYIGEVISKEEVMWRVERKADDDPLYFLELDSANFIDAEYFGNLSRLINHSCDPNCRIVKYSSAQGKRVVGIFAKRDIEVGEELTFDYNYGVKSTFAFHCFCRAPNCKVIIGRRQENEENMIPNGKKSGTEPKHDARWEDECATCGTRGELLMCDFEDCRKAHHLHCVNLAATPKGTWNCPLHDPNMDTESKGKLEPYKLRIKGPPSKKRKLATKVEIKKPISIQN